MTSEQIAELRKADPIPGGSTFPGGLPRGGPLAILPHDLFVRLLDEREALLEAVRFSLNTTVEDGHEEVARMEAALAKAESP